MTAVLLECQRELLPDELGARYAAFVGGALEERVHLRVEVDGRRALAAECHTSNVTTSVRRESTREGELAVRCLSRASVEVGSAAPIPTSWHGRYLGRSGTDSFLLTLYDDGRAVIKLGENPKLDTTYSFLNHRVVEGLIVVRLAEAGLIFARTPNGLEMRSAQDVRKPIVDRSGSTAGAYFERLGDVVPDGEGTSRMAWSVDLIRKASSIAFRPTSSRCEGTLLRRPSQRHDPPDRIWKRVSGVEPNRQLMLAGNTARR
jgi:hypothetical protein